MKVVFVNPPVIRSANGSKDFWKERLYFEPALRRSGLYLLAGLITGYNFRYGVRAGSRWPFTMSRPMDYAPFPFIMSYAAAVVSQAGHEVALLDAVVNQVLSYEYFFKQVQDQKPELIIQECSTPTLDIDLWCAECLSRVAPVALAGPHVSQFAEQMVTHYPYISFFLKGEYISSSLQLVNTMKTGVFESAVVTQVDELPFPFRDFPGADRYYDPSMPTPRPQLTMFTSKGCPYKCTFCMWPQTMYGGKLALRSPEKIIQEIGLCLAKHNYKSIFFDDDTFNIGNERISELCDGLSNIGLPWTMMGRLDSSPDWLYDKMVDSGCVGMRFGIETFDTGVLKRINKGLERTDFRKTLEHLARKYPQLMLHLTMMKDLPGQSLEIQQRDMDILNELGFSVDNVFRSYQLSSCVPFPGTQMYEELGLKEQDEGELDPRLYDGSQDTIMKKIKHG